MPESEQDLDEHCNGLVNMEGETEQQVLSELVQAQSKKIEALEKQMQQLKAAVFSNSPEKAQKLQRIAELAELNQDVTLTVVKQEFNIRASNYARELMQEATKAHNLHFFKGQPGQESYVTKFKPDNKAMHAYAEVYRELQDKPIGTEITESAIAHRYELNGQELHSVIVHLARHHEIHIVLPTSRTGCRRIKRV